MTRNSQSNSDIIVRLLKHFVAFAAISISTTVAADSTSNQDLDFTQRWYLGGGFGISQLQPNPREPDILTVSDDSDTGFHLNLGYDVNRWLSTELYLATLGEAVLDRIDVGNEQAALDSIDYLTLDLSAIGYLYNSQSGFAWSDEVDGLFCREALSFYGRVSFGLMRNDNPQNLISHGRNYNQHLAFGAGLEYGFRNGLAIRGEWISFDSDAEYANLAVVKRFGKTHCQNTQSKKSVPVPIVKIPEPPAPEPPPAEPQPLIQPTSYFGFDRSNLDAESAAKLGLFSAQILYRPGKVELSGHTDSIGSNAYNKYLSEQRVLEVRRILISNNVAPSRIVIRHFGETLPASTNDTSDGRALNRRVNLVFVPQK